MKLYYSKGACSLVPHIVAYEAGLTLDLISVDLRTKLTATGEDFRSIHRNGYVPLLILDDGKLLTEVTAIIQYLADLAPEQHLTPEKNTFAYYQSLQWLNFIATEVHKGYGLLFNPAAPEDVKPMARALLGSRMKYIAQQLEEREFILGDQYSVADAYLFVTLTWGAYIDFDINHWPVLTRYLTKISARPAVQKAMQAEGLL